MRIKNEEEETKVPMSMIENYKMKINRTACLACGRPLSDQAALELSGMPASAQDIPLREELADDCGVTLRLRRCPHCGLWQFDCNPVSYYRDVIRAVGLSETMRELRRSDFRHMLDTYGLTGKKFLECGCGRGEFMEVLQEFPVQVYATEANEEYAADAARRLGKDATVSCFFPDDALADIPGAPFDCFFSFNFLEHQPDPTAMLGCLFRNLTPGGYGLITVPSFEYILNEGRYYELIRDHIANYTLSSLKNLCIRCGFDILEEGFIGIGDTLRVVVRKPVSGRQNGSAVGEKRDADPAEDEQESVFALAQNYERMRGRMAQFTDSLRVRGLRLALFGAGHQGFTIAATTALKDSAKYIMDSAPFKQGRYAPASHLPIVPPDHFRENPVDVVMITAPGYVSEITAMLRKRFSDYPSLKICTIEPDTWI